MLGKCTLRKSLAIHFIEYYFSIFYMFSTYISTLQIIRHKKKLSIYTFLLFNISPKQYYVICLVYTLLIYLCVYIRRLPRDRKAVGRKFLNETESIWE